MDIITHIPDLNLFRAECKALAENDSKFFSYNSETKTLSYNVAQIPVRYNADYTQSVCLVRLATKDEQEAFDALTTVNRIGICENKEYIFDEGGKAIYDSVYDQSPVVIDKDTTYTPPAMIGVFA
jgi:hypothetical protein